MSFVCLSPAQVLRDDVRQDEPAPEEDALVRSALNAVNFPSQSDKLVLTLPGGGITAPGVGRDPEMAVVGPFVAVISGSLQNYAYLVRKYCLEDLSLPAAISLEAIRERTPIREAALVCKLYERLGTGMLTKLRGKFAFCLYDSSTLRVLAARDPSGEVALTQGRSEGDMLFLACGTCLPPGAHSCREIGAGQFVYGWGEDPKKYASPQQEVDKHANEAVGAAAMALKGIKLKPETGRKTGGRHSLDSLRRSSAEGLPQQRRPRRMSVDGKGSVSPDVDAWRKPRGGRKQRRNSARMSSDNESQQFRRSNDTARATSSDSKGSNKDEKKQKAKPPTKGKKAVPERKMKTQPSDQKDLVNTSGASRVDCPVPVAPVH